ncbi:MAG: hypothetical protein ICV83_30160 [Cytophagales bacterium]|nr:hypothetical protein [Cytophagales bacterium]
MGKAIFLLHFLCFSNGCQPENPGNQTAVTPGPGQCFTWSIGENTATAHLEIVGSQVKGTLEFDYAEKDDSQGKLNGTLNNDIIMAEYTFVSEGQESVMEVVFKLQGNKLIQGYAEMEEQGGKLVFKDGVKLSFQNTFVRTNCQ